MHNFSVYINKYLYILEDSTSTISGSASVQHYWKKQWHKLAQSYFSWLRAKVNSDWVKSKQTIPVPHMRTELL